MSEEIVVSSDVDWLEPDFFLGFLVDVANGGGAEVGITIHAGGLIVSGILVSAETYFVDFAERFGDAFSRHDVETGKMIRQAMMRFAEAAKPLPASERDDAKRARHIHMKQAYIFQHGTSMIPLGEGTWWRGRLTSIDGFILGSFTPSE
jgi:hypothetical protein